MPEPESQYLNKPRWTLLLLYWFCTAFIGIKSLSGVSRRLNAWNISYKRGRLHISSPDPEYIEKLEWIQAVNERAKQSELNMTVLYGDEKTVYKQAKIGNTYAETGRGGRTQATVESYPKRNTKLRIAGFLNPQSGEVLSYTKSKIGIDALCEYMYKIRTHFGKDKEIYIIWDNWPVHFHEKVINAALLNNINLLRLPTYAPWTNPIEKLWLKLNEEMLVMHKFKNDWQGLKFKVTQWLEQYARPSPDLLRYIGLGEV